MIIQEDFFESFFSYEPATETILSPKEHALISNWSKKRVIEFSTGRYCAKKTLGSLGLGHHDILIGANREPLWPEGITGSISHCDTLVGAVAGQKSKVKALGLDIETIGRVGPDIWDLVFTVPETRFLKSLDAYNLKLYSTVIFSVKECFYKLQFPLTKTYIDFKDIEISVDRDELHLSFIKDLNEIPEMFKDIVLKFVTHNLNVITYGYLL